MDLRTLDATTFARSARSVQERLHDPLHRARLLRAACADTPIIREILEAGQDVTRRADPNAEATLERMTQDLVTFLALCEIEASESSTTRRAAGGAGVASRRRDRPA